MVITLYHHPSSTPPLTATVDRNAAKSASLHRIGADSKETTILVHLNHPINMVGCLFLHQININSLGDLFHDPITINSGLFSPDSTLVVFSTYIYNDLPSLSLKLISPHLLLYQYSSIQHP